MGRVKSVCLSVVVRSSDSKPWRTGAVIFLAEVSILAAFIGFLLSLRANVWAFAFTVIVSACALVIWGAIIGTDFWLIAIAVFLVAVSLQLGYVMAGVLRFLKSKKVKFESSSQAKPERFQSD